MRKSVRKRVISFILCFAMVLTLIPTGGMKVYAETTTPTYTKVDVRNPVANSWTAKENSADGGPDFAFNGQDNNWWHSNYDVTVSDNKLSGEFTFSAVDENVIPKFSEVSSQRIWIGGEFSGKINLGKFIYQGRTGNNSNKNFIKQWALYTANVSGNDLKDADFDTIAAKGTFSSTTQTEVILPQPVEATHFRFVVFTCDKNFATASKLEMYSVSGVNTEGSEEDNDEDDEVIDTNPTGMTTSEKEARRPVLESDFANSQIGAYEYWLDKDGSIEEGKIYAITFLSGSDQRVLYCAPGSATTDRFNGSVTGEKYTVTAFAEERQSWQVVAHDGGFALKAMTSTDAAPQYLDLSETRSTAVKISNTPHKVTIQKVNGQDGKYTVSSATTNNKLGYSGNNYNSGTSAAEVSFYEKKFVTPSTLRYVASHEYSPSGNTVNQPFAERTGGSHNFRIPCIVTLSDGRIVAAADMRWNHDLDGRAIDLIVSYSDNNGKNWTFNSPLYYNDSEDPMPSNPNGSYLREDANEFNYAMTIMDPVIVADKNDHIYVLADMFPGGVAIENAVPLKPDTDVDGNRSTPGNTGFEMVDGEERLVLYASPNPASQDDNNYTHYVGDYEGEYAPVYNKQSKEVEYYVDKKFYLFNENKEPIYCMQIGNDDTIVRQNIFFYNANLHVRCATYLVLMKSTDRGETWSDPVLINQQVNKEEFFYGVGPGAGLSMENGMIIFPMYEHINGNERSSLIFSTDQGETWTRTMNSTAGSWSSESAIVKLSETKLRQFMRSGSSKLSYVDWNWNEKNGNWDTTQIVTTTQEAVKDTNQISAIRLSKNYKGKPVIIVSTATSTTGGTAHNDVRADGRLYTYVVNDDGSMRLLSSFDVWPQGSQYPHGVNYDDVGGKECYTYSSLTETKDSKISLLVETDFRPARMTYRLLDLDDICPNINFDSGNTSEEADRTPRSLSSLTAYDIDYTIIDDDDTEALRVVESKGTNYFVYTGGNDNSGTTENDGWASSFPVNPIDGVDPEILNSHSVNVTDDEAAGKYSYTLYFKGTGVDLIGKKNVAKLNIQLDGKDVTPVVMEGVSGNDIILCRMTELEDTTHTLKVTVPIGTEGTLGISYARVYGPDYAPENEERQVTEISFNKRQTEAKEVNSFIFSDGWTGNAAHLWSEAPTTTRPIWYEVDFIGSQIDIYAGKNAPHGDVIYTVYERDAYDTNADLAAPVKGPVKLSLYRGSNIDSTRTWTFRGLEEGKVYTLRAQAANSGQGNQKIIDCANVIVYSKPVGATGLQISEEAKNLTVKEGKTKQIVYSLVPENSTLKDLTFTAADENIAIVDKDGVVTGIKEGTTTITISSETLSNLKEEVSVTVEDVVQVMKGTIGDTGLQYTEEDREAVKALADSGEAKTEETLTAWKNDKATSVIALISEESALRNVTVTAGDLVHSNGSSIIASDNVTATFIKSTQAYNGGFLGYGLSKTIDNYPEPTATNRDESADILYTTEPVTIGWNELQAVWMEFDIPSDAVSGEYTTEITVTADGLEEPLTFTYVIEVANLVLPDETEFSDRFSIDFWHHPYASADYYGVEPFSADHFKILESIMELYKEVGGNTVYATMVEEPWKAQTWSPYGRDNPERSTYPSMIKWISTDGGRTFTYDYSDFDAWINFNIEHGLGDEIALFSIAPWHRTFRWYNGTGEDAIINIGSPNYGTGYEKIWTDFLTSLFEHLDKNGWLDRTYIAIDEQGFEARAFNIIESVELATGKQIKTMGFVDGINDGTKRELSKKLDYASFGDFAVQQNLSIFKTLLAERNEKGQKTVIYSCTEHRPGQFSLSQPVESYWAVANAGKQGATGFSRWAWDAWTENPLEDATGFAFEPGDCFVIYPDLKEKGTKGIAKSSIRLEMMAQAVRDMNKVYVMMNSDVADQLEGYEEALYNTITFAAYKNSSATYLSDENIAKVQDEVGNFKLKLNEMTEKYLLLTGEEPEKEVYTVTFDTHGGSKVSSVRVESGKTIELPEAPVKEGYTFGGWFTEADGKGIAFTNSTVVSGNITVYAKWIKEDGSEPDTKVYTVSFNSAGGSDIASIAVESGKTIELPEAPVKEGYTFGGWFTEADGKGTAFTSETVVNGDITVYAYWIKKEGTDRPGVSDNEPDVAVPEGIWVSGIEDATYNGKKITFSKLKVYDGEQLLKEKVDYTVSYKNNTNAYTFEAKALEEFEKQLATNPKLKEVTGFNSKKAPQVVIKMKGNYSGTKNIYFNIYPLDISEFENASTDSASGNTVSGNTVSGNGNVSEKDLSGRTDTFYIDNLSATHTGKKQKVTPVVLWQEGGRNLKLKKEFIVTPDIGNLTASGDYDVTIKGTGNFTGERVITYTIGKTGEVSVSRLSVKAPKAVNYTGNAQEPEITVKDKKDTLVQGKDYTVEYENNVAAGVASIIITGTGGANGGTAYIGTRRITFKINGISMAKAKIQGFDKSYPFVRDEIEPVDGQEVKVTVAGKNLNPDTDYEIRYEKNVYKGTASVIVTGKPEAGYVGSKTLKFKIGAINIDTKGEDFQFNFKDDMEENTYAYTKGGVKPAIELKHKGITLREGVDYTLSYKDSTKLGTAFVVIKGKGDFIGTTQEAFKIVKKDTTLYPDRIYIDVNDKVEGKAFKQNFKVVDEDGKALSNNKDYKAKEAVYTLISAPEGKGLDDQIGKPVTDNKMKLPAGCEVEITVKLMGDNYSGEVKGSYRIITSDQDISKAKIQLNDQEYTGEEVTLSGNDIFKKPVVLKNGKTLSLEGENANIEIVRYQNNIKKGTAKVTFRGLEEAGLGGYKTVTFKIVSKSVNNNWEGVCEDLLGLFSLN